MGAAETQAEEAMEDMLLGAEGESYLELFQGTRHVFEEAWAALPELPRVPVPSRRASSMAEAVAMVHARKDFLKKQASQSSSKSKNAAVQTQSLSEDRFPGAVEGASAPSAFWLYVEDYFRPLTQQDLRRLLPLAASPLADPAFHVHPTGVLASEA
ncbi:hypothetical protein H632_c5535p0, partial [Helicosporidium sp. ATCC 50920]